MTDQLVVGRGEVYFKEYSSPGELYLGNTPGFSLDRKMETRKRSTSYDGKRVELPPVVVQDKISLSIATDNLAIENIGLWSTSTPDMSGQTSGGPYEETFTVRRGHFYQLGSSVNPAGLRHAVSVVLKQGVNTVPVDGNIEINYSQARFRILETANDLNNGEMIKVIFSVSASDSVSVQPAPKLVTGAIRYIGTNPIGPVWNVFFPEVDLTPRGSFDFKSDQWVSVQFDVNVRKKDFDSPFYHLTQVAY
ncbi:hypothetical protein [Roseibium sediminis]|uniref:phage tail tube protein n=1 Tax=Roseibium sediminis TaxID=1775174 RepID=UPI00123E024A|nr:hypothetical protein [Roseibium sediminis]